MIVTLWHRTSLMAMTLAPRSLNVRFEITRSRQSVRVIAPERGRVPKAVDHGLVVGVGVGVDVTLGHVETRVPLALSRWATSPVLFQTGVVRPQ